MTAADQSPAPTRAHRRHARTRRRLGTVVIVLAALGATAFVATLVITGDDQSRRYLSPGALPTEPRPGGPTTIAVLRTSIVDIRRRPDPSSALLTRLAARTPTDTSRALPVTDQQGNWAQLTLDDGQAGWAHTRDVDLRTMHHLIRIDLTTQTVELFERGRSILQTTITGATATEAAGTYYLTDIDGQTQLHAGGNPDAPPPDIGQPQLVLVADTTQADLSAAATITIPAADLERILDRVRTGTPIILST